MKKFLGSAAFMVLFGVYALIHYPDSLTAVNATASAATTNTPSATLASAQSAPPPGDEDTTGTDDASDGSELPTQQQTQPQPKPQPAPTPKPQPVTKPKGLYTDGTYTGPSVYVYYGNVQVRATVSGGKLTNVQFLQYPSDRSTSRMINSQAMPMLAQEAIQAQSANVDGVSGASDTSAGFRQSLASALANARS